MKNIFLFVTLMSLLTNVRADLTDGHLNYTFTLVNTGYVATITGYVGAGGDVVIPDTFGGWKVTSINNCVA